MAKPTGADPAPQPPGEPPTGGQTGTPPPAPAAGTPAPPPPPAAAEPPAPADYEKKFKGLQPVHQQLQERHKVLLTEKDTLTAQLTELQGQIGAAQAELDASETQLGERDDKLTAALDQLGDYKLLERKTALLREQAPHLLQFEQFLTVSVPDELLDVQFDAMTDDQRKALDSAITAAITSFAGVMDGYIQQQVQVARAGAIPPTSPPRPGEPTLEELYKKVVEASGSDEYEGLMATYVAAAEKQGKKDEHGLWRPPQKVT